MSISSTYRLLKKEAADREKISKKFARKSDEKLLAAIANPEHSAAAREILEELASERGLQNEATRGWVQTEESMYVAPFGRRPTLEQAMAAPRKRRRVYRTLQIIMLLCFVLAFAALGLPSESEASGYFAAFLIGGVVFWYLVGIYSWLNPNRVLLLRPFQSKKLSIPLSRFVKKNLAFRGHITTLADKYMKESRLAFIFMMIPKSPAEIVLFPLFLIPAVRQMQRWIYVGSAGSYRLLKNRQSRRFTLNMFWISSVQKLLKVRCSDTWWKNAVDLLMYTSQLIIVDLSLVKVGTEWELEKIDLRNLEKKTIFIVADDAADYARQVIAKFWPGDEAPPRLFLYQKRGNILDRDAYEYEAARIISQSHLWDGPQD